MADESALQAKQANSNTATWGCLGCLGLVVLLLALSSISGDRAETGSTPASPLEVGSTYTVNDGYIGCLAKKDLDRLIEIASSGDKAAFARFLAVTPRCVGLTAGQLVYFEGYEGWGGSIKIRPVGSTTSRFTLPEAIK